jgi:hypothetical protein
LRLGPDLELELEWRTLRPKPPTRSRAIRLLLSRAYAAEQDRKDGSSDQKREAQSSPDASCAIRKVGRTVSGQENFVSVRRRSARRRPARDHVNPACEGRGAQAVSRRRHTHMTAPGIVSGIIRFHLAEGARRCLASEHEYTSVQHRCRDAASYCRHCRALLPTIGGGVVTFVSGQIP